MRKVRAFTIRKEDRQPFQARVGELYSVEKRTLSEIEAIMEREFGKHFTQRQLRYWLSSLNRDKNVKKLEYQAIVRKSQQRKLLHKDKSQLAFRVRGVFVEPANITRWMKRYGIIEDELYLPEPSVATPSALSAWTISERGSPVSSPGAMIHSPNLVSSNLPSGSQSTSFNQNTSFETDLSLRFSTPSTEELTSDVVFDFDDPFRNLTTNLPVQPIQVTSEGLDGSFEGFFYDLAEVIGSQSNSTNLPSFSTHLSEESSQFNNDPPEIRRSFMSTTCEIGGTCREDPRHHSPEQWENYRGEISRLYQILPLHSKIAGKENVMSVMKQRHHFVATLKQYKDHISMWGLDKKNVKTKIMRAIVRKRQERKLKFGKPSRFEYNGDEVDDNRVRRFMKRNNISMTGAADKPFTPCSTPPEISVFTPQSAETWTPSPLEGNTMTCRKPVEYSNIPSPLLFICRSSKAPYSPLCTALLNSTTTDITSVDPAQRIDWESFRTGLRMMGNIEQDQGSDDSLSERQLVAELRTISWDQHETANEQKIELLRSLGLVYFSQSRYQLAEMLQLRSALMLCKHRDDPVDGTYVLVLDDILDTLVAQGRFMEALHLGKYIWHVKLAKFRQDYSTSELRTMNNLAFSYLQLSKNTEAHSLLNEILDWTRFIGNKSEPILRAMSYLANLFRRGGRFEEAANLKSCVLQVKVESFGEYSLETMPSRANLARVYLEQGLVSNAEEMYLRNLMIVKDYLHDQHVDIAYCLYCLAKVSVAQSRWLAALDYASRASDMYRAVVGEKHAWTLVCFGYMIDGYRGLGQLDQARELGDETLAKAQVWLGEDHDATRRIKMSLALTYAEQGMLLEDESLRIELAKNIPPVYDDNPLV